MARIRGKFAWGLALTLDLAARSSLADAGSSLPGSQSPGAPARATICLIAEAARGSELRSVLNELLERDNVDTRFTERARLGSAEVLETSADSGAVDVFIVPRGHDAVRLYFRAADGQRFLVRDVALSSGLDALGREVIAQVVEASVVSLLHSGVGISRAEVKAELDSGSGDALPSAGPAGASAPARAHDSAPDSAPAAASALGARRRQPFALEGWVAARYGVAWSGAGQNAQSGPGFELGLGVQRTVFVRARVSVEFDFPAQIAAGPIDARASADRWRALLDLGTSLGPARALAVSIGVGQDRSTIEPIASRERSVQLAPASRSTPAVAHTEARFEVGVADFRCAFGAVLEIPLVRTRYNLDRGTSAKQLAQPWAVRPGAALSLAWQPRLAWF